MKPMIWTYNGCNVFFDPETEMGSLTTMWEACGRLEGKDPRRWTRSQQAQDVVEALCHSLDVQKTDIVVSKRGGVGGGGGTWAHWQIATVYAHYLDPKFYLWWNEQARAHIEGRAIPVEFGAYLSQIIRVFSGAGTECAHAVRVARELGEVMQRLPSKLEALRVMIPTVESRQIADPAAIGYVYVLRVKDTNKYKIGKTRRDVEKRKKELSGPISIEFEDIAVITTDDPDLLENRFKSTYKKKRVVGTTELFYLSDRDVARIQALGDFVTAGLFDSDALAIYEQPSFIV